MTLVIMIVMVVMVIIDDGCCGDRDDVDHSCISDDDDDGDNDGDDIIYFLQTTLWGIQVPDLELQSYMKLAGLQWPIHNYLVRAHYDMEDLKGSVLMDTSGNNFHGNLFGKPDLIPVSRSREIQSTL